VIPSCRNEIIRLLCYVNGKYGRQTLNRKAEVLLAYKCAQKSVQNTIHTRLPSNLRQTALECVYFRSRDKDGRHTIRSTVTETPCCTQTSGPVFYRTGVIADWSFTMQEYGISRAFGCCDFDLDSMTFIYELNLYLRKIFSQTKMNFLCKGFRKLSYYVQTYRQLNRQTDRFHLKYYLAAERVVKMNANDVRIKLVQTLGLPHCRMDYCNALAYWVLTEIADCDSSFICGKKDAAD